MKCAVCGAAGRACARCGLDAYCSKEHQRQDWPRHKQGCRKAGLGLDSLPEELLHRVLSLVPLESLLALRLVCRRWARAVLNPAVWRHRKLDLNKQPDGLGLLRLAPALDELKVTSDGDYKTAELRILRALVDSRCEFPSLTVFTSASPAACALMVRVLEQRRSSLRKLNLELVPFDLEYLFYGYASVLAAVDAMEGLEMLTLGYEYCGIDVSVDVEYSFQWLSSLRWLWIRFGLHHSTIRSLLAANKQSLREVHNSGGKDLMQMFVEEVPSVRTVRVFCTLDRGISESIDYLRHLPDLELLDVKPPEDMGLLARFLDSSPRVPRQVKLRLEGPEELCEWDARWNMPRVYDVRLGVFPRPWRSRPPSATLSLPHVEVLYFLLLTSASSPIWVQLKSMFVASTAPRLKELHLYGLRLHGTSVGMDPAWLAQMRAQRPHLRVYSGHFDM